MLQLAPLLPGLPILGDTLEFLKEPLDVIERVRTTLGNVFRFRLRQPGRGDGPRTRRRTRSSSRR